MELRLDSELETASETEACSPGEASSNVAASSPAAPVPAAAADAGPQPAGHGGSSGGGSARGVSWGHPNASRPAEAAAEDGARASLNFDGSDEPSRVSWRPALVTKIPWES
eukprot:SAG22_NODE_5569_length_991_cov_2.366592_1_plen_110_part_01